MATSGKSCGWTPAGDLARHVRLRNARRLSALLPEPPGEAVPIDSEALYVSHLLTESGRVVASLRDATRWLEAIEEADASHLAA